MLLLFINFEPIPTCFYTKTVTSMRSSTLLELTQYEGQRI